MDEPYRILSIDGGGIRGLIPALVLEELNSQLDAHVGRYFDMIAGTSTGGILALGLSVPRPDASLPYTPEALAKLYVEQGETIFDRSAWKAVTSVDNMVDERYPADGLEEVLNARFGDRRLAEAIGDVLVPSYDIERRVPFFFKSRRACDNPGYDYPARQVARATCAAPTYFEPCKIELEDTTDYYSLVDGGVFANNPSMCALADAMNQGIPPNDVLLVSLGTGEVTRRIPHDAATDWGVAGWAKPMLDISLDGVGDTVDYQVRQILTGHGDAGQYHRFQVRLDDESDNLDDASRTNIRALRLRAADLIRNQSRELASLADTLETAGPYPLDPGGESAED